MPVLRLQDWGASYGCSVDIARAVRDPDGMDPTRWPPGFPYASDPSEPPCWAGCQPIPPGIIGQNVPVYVRDVAAPTPAPAQEQHILVKILLGALPIVVGGVTVYYLTQHRDKKRAAKANPVLAAGKGRFTGWTCVNGPSELVHYLVSHGTSVPYREFAKHIDVKSLGFYQPSKDWGITWLRTRLPSGKEAWVAQHSGIEHLCTFDGQFDPEQEASLARQWEDRDG